MANIKIEELKPAGSELFADSEDFMDELSDGEFDNTHGGGSWWLTPITPITIL